jgi:hypothetical protein
MIKPIEETLRAVTVNSLPESEVHKFPEDVPVQDESKYRPLSLPPNCKCRLVELQLMMYFHSCGLPYTRISNLD